jgi:hypothetical protein
MRPPWSSDNQQTAPLSAEHARLAEGSAAAAGGDWKLIGPYVADPHTGNRARGRQRRRRRLALLSLPRRALTRLPLERGRPGGPLRSRPAPCFALSFWNGRDPILKERIFGLSGPAGNHGEDTKEYWWSLDATPTYSWLRWLYRYPQAEFPYARLRQENANRHKGQAGI